MTSDDRRTTSLTSQGGSIGHSLVTLRDYVDRFIDEHFHRHEREREEVERRAVAIQVAIDTALASVANLADLHGVNHAKEHRAHEQIHQIEKEAREKADAVLNERLGLMNEVREQLKTQKQEFAGREYVDSAIESLDQRIERLRDQAATLVARDTFEAALAAKVAERTTAITALQVRVVELERRATLGEGRSKGLTAGWGYLVAGVTVVVIVVNLAFYIAGR